MEKRTPIETKDVGRLIYVKDSAQPEGSPVDIPKDGVPQVPWTHEGPKASPGEIYIIINYVKVHKVPSKLHVYSLTYWRPSQDPSKPATRVVLNKRVEIKQVFETLVDADILALKQDKTLWTIDFKSLWCGSALQGLQQKESEWSTPGFPCTLLDGRKHQDVHESITSSGVLNNIEKFLGEADITECTDHIRALNAHVTQCVRQYNEKTGKSTTQLGANKFYIDQAFNEMTHKRQSIGLRAVRGYYMSVRPGSAGPLLNVNVAITAFLPPILVSEFLSMLPKSKKYVETILRGTRVRLAYRRQEFKEIMEGIPVSDDLQRTNVFQQFGTQAGKQKFFTVLANNSGDQDSTRIIKPADIDTTILKYFQSKLKDAGNFQVG